MTTAGVLSAATFDQAVVAAVAAACAAERGRRPDQAVLLGRIEQFCTLGGKRLRPRLLAIGHGLFGGAAGPRLAQVGASLELFHGFLLMHDDIMDESELRRGRPTMHRQYEADAAPAARAGHYGCSMALLAGDLAASLALGQLVQGFAGLPTSGRALALYEATVNDTIYGQAEDVALSSPAAWDSDRILAVYRQKTSAYSVYYPLVLGGLLAAAAIGPHDERALRAYADAAGIAFQLRDDRLGLFGSATKTGKRPGEDIVQGKRTLLLADALTGLTAPDRAELLGLLGRPITDGELLRVQALVAASGALVRVEERIARLRAQAAQALAGSEWDPAWLGELRLLEPFFFGDETRTIGGR